MNWRIIAVVQPNQPTVYELWIDGWKRGTFASWGLAELARKRELAK